MSIDFPGDGSGQVEGHQLASGRRGGSEGAKGCSNRAKVGQLNLFHSVCEAGGPIEADKILLRRLSSGFLQSWGIKKIPLDFKGLLSVSFGRQGTATRGLRNHPLVARP